MRFLKNTHLTCCGCPPQWSKSLTVEELRLRAAATELRPVNTAAAWPRNFERLWVLGRLVTYCHLHSKLFAYQAAYLTPKDSVTAQMSTEKRSATEKLLTDLHVAYIQKLGQVRLVYSSKISLLTTLSMIIQ